MNSLDSVVTLTREQLPLAREAYDSCGNSSSCDDKLLIFPRSEWERLKTRTEELKAERATHKQKFKWVEKHIFIS